MRTLLFVVMCVVALVAMGMMAFAPQKAEVGSLTVEERNNLLNQVVFSLEGSPSSEMALFVGADTLATRLTPGEQVTLSLDGNERMSVSLRACNGNEWNTLHSFGTIDYGATIRIEVQGLAVKVWLSSQD